MANNKNSFDRETIQAIAQELKSLQDKERAKNETNASARDINKNARDKQKNKGVNPQPNKTQRNAIDVKSIGSIVVILIWAIVFLIVAVKLAPYL